MGHLGYASQVSKGPEGRSRWPYDEWRAFELPRATIHRNHGKCVRRISRSWLDSRFVFGVLKSRSIDKNLAVAAISDVQTKITRQSEMPLPPPVVVLKPNSHNLNLTVISVIWWGTFLLVLVLWSNQKNSDYYCSCRHGLLAELPRLSWSLF